MNMCDEESVAKWQPNSSVTLDANNTPVSSYPLVVMSSKHAACAANSTAVRDIYCEYGVLDTKRWEHVWQLNTQSLSQTPAHAAIPHMTTEVPVCRTWKKTGCCRWGAGCQLAHHIGKSDSGRSIGVAVFHVM